MNRLLLCLSLTLLCLCGCQFHYNRSYCYSAERNWPYQRPALDEFRGLAPLPPADGGCCPAPRPKRYLEVPYSLPPAPVAGWQLP